MLAAFARDVSVVRAPQRSGAAHDSEGRTKPGSRARHRHRFGPGRIRQRARDHRRAVIERNAVHGTKKSLHDGGSLYNLSANPGGSIDHNLGYDNPGTVGLYLDNVLSENVEVTGAFRRSIRMQPSSVSLQ